MNRNVRCNQPVTSIFSIINRILCVFIFLLPSVFSSNSLAASCSTSFTWDGAGVGNEAVFTRLQTSIDTTITGCATDINVNVSLDNPDGVFYSNINGSNASGTDGTFEQPGYTMWLDNNNILFDSNAMDLDEEASIIFVFSRAVTLSNIRVVDLDWRNSTVSSRWRDKVTVTAMDGNNVNVPLTATKADATSSITISGQTAITDYNTTTGSDGGLGVADQAGWVNWSSSTPLTTLRITYKVGVGNSGQQVIQIPNFDLLVEDPPIEEDYGDAPATYGDPLHIIVPDLYLGIVEPDAETTTQYSANASGDGDDEEGVTLETLATGDTSYSIPAENIVGLNTTGSVATLTGFIDFNQDNDFDEIGEVASVTFNSGDTSPSNDLVFSGFTAVTTGEIIARFRLSTDGVLSHTGSASDGEVEDYLITIRNPGISVSGRVYVDTNSNALEDATESGVGGTVVVLRDTTIGSCRSVVTNASGEYRFAGISGGSYELYQADSESTPIPQHCDTGYINNPSGYQSTTPDILTFNVTDVDISDQDFGEVAGTNSSISGNTGIGIAFEPDHQGVILPGNTTFYSHTFTTEADGVVRFTTTDGGYTTTGWTHTIYQDSDCNGILGGVEANAPINGIDFDVSAGSRICIFDKVYAPSNVSAQDRYEVIITAVFAFAGGTVAPTSLNVVDTTIAGQTAEGVKSTTPEVGPSRLALTKTVENTTQGTTETKTLNQAKPGDFLTYRIYYRNTGTGPITELNIYDTAPPFTNVVGSNTCDVTPSSMTCTPNLNIDQLNWAFTDSLASGAGGHVSYEVMVEEN